MNDIIDWDLLPDDEKHLVSVSYELGEQSGFLAGFLWGLSIGASIAALVLGFLL